MRSPEQIAADLDAEADVFEDAAEGVESQDPDRILLEREWLLSIARMLCEAAEALRHLSARHEADTRAIQKAALHIANDEAEAERDALIAYVRSHRCHRDPDDDEGWLSYQALPEQLRTKLETE